MSKPITVFSAAKRLGEKSGWTLSNLQMQKLIYIAHMYYMGRCDDPLIIGHFEAWDYGPVHPLLYHRLKTYGADFVPPEALHFASPVRADHLGGEYLDAVVTQLDPDELVAITHWGEGAWALNYRPKTKGIRIPNEDIKQEYNKRTTVNE